MTRLIPVQRSGVLPSTATPQTTAAEQPTTSQQLVSTVASSITPLTAPVPFGALPAAGNDLLPPLLTTLMPPVPTSQLVPQHPPTVLNTSSGNTILPSPAWLQSIAHQAAQSALTQALGLHTNINPPASLPSTAPQPLAQSVQLSPIHSTSQLPNTMPLTSTLPLPAAASITSLNLPGELSGMLPHTIVSKMYFDLSSLLPSNLALAHNPQSVHVQLGGDDGQQLVLAHRPSTKKSIASIHD